MENIKGRFFKELNTYYVFPEDGKMAILYQDGSHTLLAVGDNLSYGGKFTQEMLKEGLSRCIGTAEFALDHLTWKWKMTKRSMTATSTALGKLRALFLWKNRKI